MRLGDLVQALPEQKSFSGDGGVTIDDITFDSRAVRPGSLFVAIRGWEQDGHRYIPDAVRRGAAAVVCDEPGPMANSLPCVVVPSTRQALAVLASAFHDFPGKKLHVVGVTGTDGKTTTTNLIGAMLNAAGMRAGLLSTIRAEFGGQSVDTGLHTTTPNPVEVQRYLAQMVMAGARYAVLETTSHALDQERTLGCEFDVAVVTNVTPEHLDYHRTYGQYLATKGKLFASLAQAYHKFGVPKVSITNVDDVSYGYLREFPAERHVTYGIDGDADVTARRLEWGATQSCFQVVTPGERFEVRSPLPGRHNVYNLLAATAVAFALGVPAEAIAAGAAAIGTLTGRWEQIDTGDDFTVVVDFAHTPNSLRQALRLARAQTRGRVIVVFGCAGLRDVGKRPIMGEIAGELADVTVITAEDPRTEDLDEIMQQIAAGCARAGRTFGKDYFKIGDRARAIESAIAMAAPGDLVLLTGKGHERSLCIGDVEYPWSEHEAAAQGLALRRLARQGAVEEEEMSR